MAVALSLVLYLGWIRLKEKRILRWPQVPARVLTNSLEFTPVRRRWGLAISEPSAVRLSRIEFEYEYLGVSYQGRKILPVNWTLRYEEQEQVRQQLQSFAVALCNPQEPSEAYLDLPLRWHRGSISWVTAGLSLSLLILLGLLFLLGTVQH